MKKKFVHGLVITVSHSIFNFFVFTNLAAHGWTALEWETRIRQALANIQDT